MTATLNEAAYVFKTAIVDKVPPPPTVRAAISTPHALSTACYCLSDKGALPRTFLPEPALFRRFPLAFQPINKIPDQALERSLTALTTLRPTHISADTQKD